MEVFGRYASFDYMKKGVTSEDKYAYTSGKTKSAGSCNSRKARSKVASVSEYALTTEDDEPEMLQALAQKGPLAVAVCTDDWQFYSSGTFDGHCEANGGNVDHAVMAVAYTDSTILIKNSWGTGWGEEGYITLERGINHCNVAKYGCWVQCA